MNLSAATSTPSEVTGSVPASGGELAWYCVRTKPKHEHIAAANIARQAGLEVFCPRLRVERMTRRCVVRVLEPLFPCYLFVRCAIEESFDNLRYANGVGTIVNFGGQLARVPDAVVEELKNHFEGEETVVAKDNLTPGTEVIVAAGAFEGMRASVLRVLPARRRVQVLLDILGRPTAVEVERNAVTLEQDSLADRIPFMAAA